MKLGFVDNFLAPDLTAREAQPADVLILWLPVFLMMGMGLYFALPREPATPFLLGLLMGVCACIAVTRRWRDTQLWRWGAAIALSITLGLSLAQFRTFQLATPLLTENMWGVHVAGTIQSAERAGAGWRVVLKDTVLNDKTDKKYTLRLSIRKRGGDYSIGGKLEAKAGLMPASPPFVPGMFDFQRHAYFNNIGGYGYVTRVLSYVPPQDKAEEFFLERYREWLSGKVYDVLAQPEAGIVTALLNGQRAGISQKTTNSLQASGLQHIISISGLHVGLMAGVVFYFVRLLLACSMTLALRWPIKKIAAMAAMVAIILYMFIVGLSPPTVRSVIMTGIVLLAIIVDREAINLRIVAIAAILILVWQPESVLDIGFQLSFAAVVGLVAFFQATQSFWRHETWQSSILMKIIRVFLMTIATSLIATFATAPLTLVHFQKIPVLSMLANILATPAVTFLIMPGTFLAYLLTPFGIVGTWAIDMMGWGVTCLLRISTYVTELPAALWRMPAPSFMAVVVMMAGIYHMLVAKSKFRWCGVIPVAVACIWMASLSSPDMMLTQDRVLVAPDPHSKDLFIEGKVDRFQKTLLLQRTGKETIKPFPCAGDICDLVIAKQKLRIVRTVEALPQACENAQPLIVTRYYLDKKCADALVVDRHNLDRQGGVALWLGGKIRLESVLSPYANRPWQQRAVKKDWNFGKYKARLKPEKETP